MPPATAELPPYVDGVDVLEHDGERGFRWTQRFFGIYLAREGVTEVELTLLLPSPPAPATLGLDVRVGGGERVHHELAPGRHSLRIPVHPAARARAVLDVECALERWWSPPDPADPRRLGVRLERLVSHAADGEREHPIEGWERNPPRALLERCDALYAVRPAARPAAPSGADVSVSLANAAANVRERVAGVAHVTSTPLKVYVELAWQCHLRCPSCFHAYTSDDGRAAQIHFMSPFVFRSVADALFAGARLVWLSGNGEVMLHPNITTILGTAREFEFVPALLTSGSLFNEANMRALVEGGFFLSVSVDSPEPGLFERLRKGAKFRRLVAGLTRLEELRRETGNRRFHVRVQCVAQQANLGQLAALVEWCAGLGVQEVQLLPLHRFGREGDAYFSSQMLDPTPDAANRAALDAVRAGTRHGLRVRPFPAYHGDAGLRATLAEAVAENWSRPIPADEFYAAIGPVAEHPANDPAHTCFMAWSEAFIGSNGLIAPCDMVLSRTTVGNFHDDPFEVIWNGARMAEMRSWVNGADPHGLCAHGTCMFRPARPAAGAALALS